MELLILAAVVFVLVVGGWSMWPLALVLALIIVVVGTICS